MAVLPVSVSSRISSNEQLTPFVTLEADMSPENIRKIGIIVAVLVILYGALKLVGLTP